ncbi:hypothetical protein QAD02_023665 [Eretmocerus hayati]|uniref:Uncharacterized protein n=1 Tax=Eretmocerus hayati TaxID=131215 RepID=A0ACC2Q1D7_9HYME|nr:hypothetical protein QAD02_023665 [Eretmocerus hayati]
MIFGIIIYIISLLLVAVVGQLETIFQWRYIDYVWPSEAKKQQAIQSGDYNVTEPMPMDFAIDECNRLWVLDSATSLTGKEASQCHPKLLVFDLWTDTLLTKISIPKSIAANARTKKSLLTNLKIETGGHFCENTTVTIAQDSKRLQYVDGIKVIPKNIFGVEEVWFITNRLVHHDRRNVWNISEINFRILRSPVKDLIAGTECELPKKFGTSSRKSKTHGKHNSDHR